MERKNIIQEIDRRLQVLAERADHTRPHTRASEHNRGAIIELARLKEMLESEDVR